MISDMPKILKRESSSASSKVVGFADDTTVYSKALSIKELKNEMEIVGNNMITYCNANGLILNSQKTQIIMSTGSDTLVIKNSKDHVPVSQQIKLLGVEYDTKFSTAPYLRKLAQDAKTRSKVIQQLSFCMPQCLLKPLTNGILFRKIIAAASAAIPIQISDQDKLFQSKILEDINKSIKAAARTITKTKLKDKVPSNIVLWKAGLPSLNQAVSASKASLIWKARRQMNQLGQIFQTSKSNMNTRASLNEKLSTCVPGHYEAVSNDLANIRNHLDFLSAKSAMAAKALAKKYFN